jgi:DUF971 family protein
MIRVCPLVPRRYRDNLVSRIARSKAQSRAGRTILAEPWPTEIRLSKDRRTLTVAFDDTTSHVLPAEYLRVFSPSAEVQGHSPEQRVTVGGKAAVEIRKVEPVGNYAVRLTFDDLHNTGIYTWSYLRKLGEEHSRRWADYLAELEAKGLSRDASAMKRK